MGQLRTSEPEQHMEGIHQAKGQPDMGYQSQQDEEWKRAAWRVRAQER